MLVRVELPLLVACICYFLDLTTAQMEEDRSIEYIPNIVLTHLAEVHTYIINHKPHNLYHNNMLPDPYALLVRILQNAVG